MNSYTMDLPTQMPGAAPESNIKVPFWYPELAEGNWRQAILWGPRWGFKTSTVATYTINWLLNPVEEDFEGKDCFIARMYAKDSTHSFYKALKLNAQMRGLDHLFRFYDGDARVVCLTTERQAISGGVYSTKDKGGVRGLEDIGLLIGEEMHEWVFNAILHMENTVFRNLKTKAIYMGNRVDRSAFWKYKSIKEKADDSDTYIRKCHWKDADYLSPKQLLYIVKFKQQHPDRYGHEFEGEALVNKEAQVYTNEDWRFGNLDDYVKAHGIPPLFGLDIGWTKSDTALVKGHYCPDLDGGTLYISDIHTAKNMKATDFPSFLAGDDTVYPHNPRWENPRHFKGMIPADEIDMHEIMADTDWAAIRELADVDPHGGVNFNVTRAKSVMMKAIKSEDMRVKGAYWLKHLPGGIVINEQRAAGFEEELMGIEFAPWPGQPGVYNEAKIAKKGYDHRWDATRYLIARLVIPPEIDDEYDAYLPDDLPLELSFNPYQ